MDNPVWSKEDQTKARAASFIPKIKSAELIAEQIINYLFPGVSHKKLGLVLMLFEMLKVYFRFKAFFSGQETLVMEEKLFAYFMADKKRKEFLKKRAENIFGLFKLQAQKLNKENYMETIYKTLGLKLKPRKIELPPQPVNPDPEAGIVQMVPAPPPLVKDLVADKESLIENFSFNEEYETYLPRKKKAVGVLKSLPIPERLQVDPPMPAIMKVSECLYILRPLFYCLFVTLCEETSYLPVGVSAGIDALSVILRMGYKRRSVPEIEELKSRNRELLTIYLFRKPIYTNFTRPRIIEPLVRRFIKWETIANMILQTIDFRTSYSLTLELCHLTTKSIRPIEFVLSIYKNSF